MLGLRFSDRSGWRSLRAAIVVAGSGEGPSGCGDAGVWRDSQRCGGALRGEAEPAVSVAMPGQAGKAGPARHRDGGRTGPLRAAGFVRPGATAGDKLRLIFGDVAILLATDTPAARIAEIVHALGTDS